MRFVTMTLLWPSNWIIMRQCLRDGLIVAAISELGARLFVFAGLLKLFPGFILVLWWTLHTSVTYAVRRDRVDGSRGAVVAGLVLASFFGALMWLVLIVQGRVIPKLVYAIFGYSLFLSWSIAVLRRWRGDRR